MVHLETKDWIYLQKETALNPFQIFLRAQEKMQNHKPSKESEK